MSLYRHYKGKNYIGMARGIIVNNTPCVLYKDLNGLLYLRPEEIFDNYVNVNQRNVERFKLMKEMIINNVGKTFENVLHTETNDTYKLENDNNKWKVSIHS